MREEMLASTVFETLLVNRDSHTCVLFVLSDLSKEMRVDASHFWHWL